MASSEPLIRPPLQRRSQESLDRVLRAGLQVLQEEGFEGFTLQEVSRRAGVSIGSIYARVSSREALIMAIYEYAMAWTDEQDQIERDAVRDDLSPRERIELLVTDTANTMLAHADILRVFMRQAPVNPEIWERGAEKSQDDGQGLRAGDPGAPGAPGPSRARVGRRRRLPDDLLHDRPPHHPRAEVRVLTRRQRQEARARDGTRGRGLPPLT